MKISAGAKSVLVFCSFAFAALVAFLSFKTTLLSYGSFIVVFLIGSVAASRVFDRNATNEEKRADLAERNRNPLG